MDGQGQQQELRLTVNLESGRQRVGCCVYRGLSDIAYHLIPWMLGKPLSVFIYKMTKCLPALIGSRIKPRCASDCKEALLIQPGGDGKIKRLP